MTKSPEQFTILALEASADQASAAILRADGSESQYCHRARHGHAALITELARSALADVGMDAAGVTHVAAGRGPGSFTGIRVALAAAKGFGLACGAAGIGVSCLAAMAHTAHASLPQAAGRTLLVTADTRRGSYFTQAFSPAGEPLSQIVDLDPDSDQPLPLEWNGALLIGPGAAPLAAGFAESGLEPDLGLPALDSLHVARKVADVIGRGQTAEPLVPLYVAPAFLGPRKS